MRLIKSQKEQVLAWIAEGLTSDAINRRAAKFEPPFSVLRSQVTYYRKSRKVDIDRLVQEGEDTALKSGLAKRAIRLGRLQALARLLEADLLEKEMLWLPQVKSIGSGKDAQVVHYEEFNRSEIEAYRGLLDDIARELGHRIKGIDMTSGGEKIKVIGGVNLDEV